jgi:Tol biopolymer transport system component
MARLIGGGLLLTMTLMIGIVSATLGAAAVFPYAGEIAYMRYHPINPDIMLHDVARGTIYNLTEHPAYDAAPSWSPDGAWLAFLSNRGEGGNQVYVMRDNGRDLRRLTDGVGTYSVPRWSADGARLVFFALHIGANALFSVNLDGTNLVQVSGEDVTPGAILMDLGIESSSISRVLSPDRRRVMFLAYRGAMWGIYVAPRIESGGYGADRLLTPISNFAEIPVWSPDGTRIAFIERAGGMPDVYMIDVPPDSVSEIPRPIRLTTTRAIESFPAWRPA